MNTKQAVARLKKIIGPKIAWQTRADAPNAEGRAAASAEWSKLRESENTLKAEVDAMRAKLLSDPAYQELLARLSVVRKRVGNESAASRRFAITVGKSGGTAGFNYFHVMFEGDNWDDVVAKAEAKQERVA